MKSKHSKNQFVAGGIIAFLLLLSSLFLQPLGFAHASSDTSPELRGPTSILQETIVPTPPKAIEDAAPIETSSPPTPAPSGDATIAPVQDEAPTDVAATKQVNDVPQETTAEVEPENQDRLPATAEATEVVRLEEPAALMAAEGSVQTVEPDIELGVACPQPGVARFTLRNVGSDMLSPGTYTISDPASERSFQLQAGASTSFEAAGGATVDARYTSTSIDDVALHATGECITEPSNTPVPADTGALGPSNTPPPTNTRRPTNIPTITLTPSITFTPSNTPRPTHIPTITPTPSITFTPSNTPTPSMTYTPSNTPTPSMTFTPSNTPIPSMTYTPSITSTPSMTFTPSNTPLPSNTPTNTLTPSPTPTPIPGTTLIELSVACFYTVSDGTINARFQLQNLGGDMLAPGTYTLTEPGEAPAVASFQLMAGEKSAFVAVRDSRVEALYSTITVTRVYLAVTGTCTTNRLGEPFPTSTPQLNETPASVPTVPTSLPTSPNEVVLMTAPVTAPTLRPEVVLTTAPVTAPTLRPEVVLTTTLVTAPTLAPEGMITACGAASEIDTNSLPIIDMSECAPDTSVVERPAWTPIVVGERGCPAWLVYHTNMTGDWEIFRLGELADGVQADPNLSRGVGRRVYDLMPSRSPDQSWVTFTSNRDGNWEIYISAVEQPFLQRVTYNTNAVDLDPVWSPTGEHIVYESNRSGNWQLYLLDVTTGEETQLTSSSGNNVNASWAYGGEKIAYQSDRDGFWQIFELEIASLVERRLSDGVGDDHAPEYSSDDQKIAFRSFRDGDNSVVYFMNADGSQLTRVSDPTGYALNHSWSPDDQLITYQSDLDGDNDIYVYDVATHTTRLMTNNTIEDYAPTWLCSGPVIVFTSDVTQDSNLFSAPALPISAGPILVEEEATQLTSAPESDQYPLDNPSEENASRQESFPSPVKNK